VRLALKVLMQHHRDFKEVIHLYHSDRKALRAEKCKTLGLDKTIILIYISILEKLGEKLSDSAV
jgi:hypothetical protein